MVFIWILVLRSSFYLKQPFSDVVFVHTRDGHKLDGNILTDTHIDMYIYKHKQKHTEAHADSHSTNTQPKDTHTHRHTNTYICKSQTHKSKHKDTQMQKHKYTHVEQRQKFRSWARFAQKSQTVFSRSSSCSRVNVRPLAARARRHRICGSAEIGQGSAASPNNANWDTVSAERSFRRM
jgi:hypothetical protein